MTTYMFSMEESLFPLSWIHEVWNAHSRPMATTGTGFVSSGVLWSVRAEDHPGVFTHIRGPFWVEQRPKKKPGYLGYIGDGILPSHVGDYSKTSSGSLLNNQDRDLMESIRGFISWLSMGVNYSISDPVFFLGYMYSGMSSRKKWLANPPKWPNRITPPFVTRFGGGT